MRTDHFLLVVALIFLAVTLFLVGLSFQMTDFGLRVETVAYATYVFFTGVAVLVLVEVLHLAKREIGKHHGS